MKRLLAFAVVLVGCNDDIDQPWELDHDRIIAVRADPPALEPGETARIDVLLGYETLPAEAKRPDGVAVASPESLADTVHFDGTDWLVTAPSAERLDAARSELGLAADEPVPLRLGIGVIWPTPVMSPGGAGFPPNTGFAATKVVLLGREGINPPMNGLTIDGVEPAEDVEIVFSKAEGAKTQLFVEADDSTDIVSWLSSCGEVHDFDLHAAYVTVGEEDRTEGQLALVLRDELGGVSWRVWNCRAE